MPLKNAYVSGAMFDIKPVREAGGIDVEKIESVTGLVNLAVKKNKELHKKLSVHKNNNEDNIPVVSNPAAPIPAQPPQFSKDIFHNELEDMLNGPGDIHIDLASVGGKIVQPTIITKPRLKPIIAASEIENKPPVPEPEDPNMERALKEIQRSLSGAVNQEQIPNEKENNEEEQIPEQNYTPQLESISDPVFVEWMQNPPSIETEPVKFSLPKINLPNFSRRNLLILGISVLGVGLVMSGAVALKNKVTGDSVSAVQNLEQANESVKNLDFEKASSNFLQAYQDFSKASGTLNFMGSSISSFISDLPGGASVKSAQNLTEAGKRLANAGGAISQAINAISKTGIIFNTAAAADASVGQILSSMTEALMVAKTDVTKANQLLADVDSSVIPADNRAKFEEFRSKLPEFQKLLSDGVDYAGFLESLIDVKGSKKYLILFQNTSELRPTGGFPGTYGVVIFKDGKLKDFKVDDVYNLDGQIKENIIPPRQLQHITPTWGMRDANWFVDFPTSARKVMEFYKKESQNEVDGVLTLNPAIISKILAVVGPIELPEYNRTITSENFATAIQDEVEYGENRQQPKSIVMDLAPKLLEKIYSANSDQWLTIFNAFIAGLDGKDILVYSKNINVQSFAVDKGFAGQVVNTDGDYLMPVITNVKGSKTDTVTDTSFSLTTRWENGQVVHALTISRTHNGGKSKFGFHNKQNPAFVRVLVPEGSEMISVNGNDSPNYNMLVDYAAGFVTDPDLVKFEENATYIGSKDIRIFKEAGKTEFGFWLVTDPGQTKTVTLEYKVPKSVSKTDYKIFVQKQPGLEVSKFDFNIKAPTGLNLDASTISLVRNGESYFGSSSLEKDLPIRVQFK